MAYWSLSNCTGTSPLSCPDGSSNVNPATTDPAPSVAVTSPANGATGVTGSLTIAATCTDIYGVTSVAFSVDGVSIGSDTTSPYSMAFDTTLLNDSANPHTATATCTNIGGASASNTFSTNNGTITPRTYYVALGGRDSFDAGAERALYRDPHRHCDVCATDVGQCAAIGDLYRNNLQTALERKDRRNLLGPLSSARCRVVEAVAAKRRSSRRRTVSFRRASSMTPPLHRDDYFNAGCRSIRIGALALTAYLVAFARLAHVVISGVAIVTSFDWRYL